MSVFRSALCRPHLRPTRNKGGKAVYASIRFHCYPYPAITGVDDNKILVGALALHAAKNTQKLQATSLRTCFFLFLNFNQTFVIPPQSPKPALNLQSLKKPHQNPLGQQETWTAQKRSARYPPTEHQALTIYLAAQKEPSCYKTRTETR